MSPALNPPEEVTPTSVRLSRSLLERIDALAAQTKPKSTRTQAISQLLEYAVGVFEKDQPKKSKK